MGSRWLLLLFLGALSVSCREELPASQPLGRVEITVGDLGYTPSEVRATRGAPLTMVFTRTTESICGAEVVIPEHDIRRELPLNEPVEVTFTPTKAGQLTFMCGMSMMKGTIIVR